MTYIKEYKCVVTGSTVPAERAKFLLEMGVSDDELTIASVSPIRRVRIPTGKCEFGVDETELIENNLMFSENN